MPKLYYQPLAQEALNKSEAARALAGGWAYFDQVNVIDRKGACERIPVSDVPTDIVLRLTAPRSSLVGLTWDRPRLMGILNVTPDSFSDGGQHSDLTSAVARAIQMTQEGAEILDIGGESTRPGAAVIDIDEEIARTAPVIAALSQSKNLRENQPPISIDTRKAQVAEAAIRAGARMLNDVSAFSFDPDMLQVAIHMKVPVCIMHAQGDPKTMQANPSYENVVLDVYDDLEARIEMALEAGLPRQQIIVDPGIGFGKTLEHNLALLQNLSLFHGLGCVVLLGASRKRFIGTIGKAQDTAARVPGSIAVALHAIRQGVQIIRAHDISETSQAISLWRALTWESVL